MTKELQVTDLIEMSVSSVCFVMDYVEIHFDGPILRCLSDPILVTDAEEWTFPEAGSRDALCSLIGQRAQEVKLDDARAMEMRFESGVRLIVPLDLDATKGKGPEAMHFVPIVGGPIQVWY